MKKLVLMLAVAFSMSFFACGNKEAATETEAAAVDTVEAVVEEAAVAACTCDTCTCDTCTCAEVAQVAEVAEAPVAE